MLIMNKGLASLLLCATMLAQPALAQWTVRPVEIYKVTRLGGGLGIHTDETVIFFVQSEATGAHWTAKRNKTERNWCGARAADGGCSETVSRVEDNIDGASCPELLKVLEALSRVPVSGFAPPQLSALRFSTVTDTPFVEVTGIPALINGDGPQLKVGGSSGPIVDWWTESTKSLSPRWAKDTGRR